MRPLIRSLSALALAVVAVPLASGSASAATCSFDQSTHTVSISVDPTPTLWIMSTLPTPDAGTLIAVVQPDIGGGERADCGWTKLEDTDRISVTGAGGTLAILPNPGAPFAPGFTPEPTGQSEVEIDVHGIDTIQLVAQGAATTLTAGSKGLSWNTDDDADVTFSGATTISMVGGGGDDLLSARGGFGTGRALPAQTIFQVRTNPAGPGSHDTVLGHNGVDDVWVRDEASADVRTFGGDDRLEGGSGAGPYLLDGGAGNDSFVLHGAVVALGSGGDDSFSAANGLDDVIRGGAGTDTGQVDPGDVVSSLELRS